MSTKNVRSVEIRIDELVLHGLSAREGREAAEAIERELIRALRELGVPESLSSAIDVERIDAGQVAVPRDQNSKMLGASVGGSIDRALRTLEPSEKKR